MTQSLLVYDVRAAWHRAVVYFVACWLVGWGSGVLTAVFSAPLATTAHMSQAGWWGLTAVALLIILIGYGIIWPKGTRTYGRPLHWPTVLLFGLLWGTSEGLLFASVWSLVSRFVTANWLVVVVTFLLLAAFIGLWHALYWDIYVAPDHNIVEWNGRKVLLAHTPNLLVSLTYLTLFGNIGIFILLQTLALLLSTYFMRFPAYK